MAIKNTKFVYEVVDLASKATSRQDKIKILKDNESWALKDILRGSFDEVIRWNLPAGEVPYTPADPSSVPSSLFKQHQKFKYFAKGGPGDNMIPIKRETMFVRLMEAIHPGDAKLVESMINKKPPAKGITKKLVQEAFPNLIVK